MTNSHIYKSLLLEEKFGCKSLKSCTSDQATGNLMHFSHQGYNKLSNCILCRIHLHLVITIKPSQEDHLVYINLIQLNPNYVAKLTV